VVLKLSRCTPEAAQIAVLAALSLAVFAWLLTLHPTATGRVYAAYGAVYVSVALVWLRVVEGVPLTFRDLVGALVVLAGRQES